MTTKPDLSVFEPVAPGPETADPTTAEPVYDVTVKAAAEAVEQITLAPKLARSGGDLVAQMSAIVEVLNDEQANRAAQLIADSKAVTRSMDEFFDPLIKPIHAAWKSLTGQRAASKANIESEAGRLQASIDAHLTRERKKREERERLEAERRRHEQEEAQRIERERLEAARLAESQRLEQEAQAKREEAARLAAEAAERDAETAREAERTALAAIQKQNEADALIAAGHIERGQALMEEAATAAEYATNLMDAPSAAAQAERLLEEADHVAARSTEMLERAIDVPEIAIAPVMAAPIKASAVGASAGLKGTREVWKFEVIDKALVPAQYLIVDEKAIAAAVTSLKGRAIGTIPGVRVYSEVKSSIGASK